MAECVWAYIMNKSIESLHNFWLQHRFRLILNKSKTYSFLKKLTAELTEELVLEVLQSFGGKNKKESKIW